MTFSIDHQIGTWTIPCQRYPHSKKFRYILDGWIARKAQKRLESLEQLIKENP